MQDGACSRPAIRMAKRPRKAQKRQKRRSGRQLAHSIAAPISGNRKAGRNVFRRDTPERTPAPEWEDLAAKHSPKSGNAGEDYSRPAARRNFRKSARA